MRLQKYFLLLLISCLFFGANPYKNLSAMPGVTAEENEKSEMEEMVDEEEEEVPPVAIGTPKVMTQQTSPPSTLQPSGPPITPRTPTPQGISGAPATVPVATPISSAPSPTTPTETVQSSQFTWPVGLELEKEDPKKDLAQHKNPKIVAIFNQAEELCSQMDTVAKNLETIKNSLRASFDEAAGKKLDTFLQETNIKRGILQQEVVDSSLKSK
ncbi:MAG: hypothetical protein V1855_00060 [bacterium]